MRPARDAALTEALHELASYSISVLYFSARSAAFFPRSACSSDVEPVAVHRIGEPGETASGRIGRDDGAAIVKEAAHGHRTHAACRAGDH